MSKRLVYLVNCFFLASFSFWVTGVMRLSVGDMKFGLLYNGQVLILWFSYK